MYSSTLPPTLHVNCGLTIGGAQFGSKLTVIVPKPTTLIGTLHAKSIPYKEIQLLVAYSLKIEIGIPFEHLMHVYRSHGKSMCQKCQSVH